MLLPQALGDGFQLRSAGRYRGLRIERLMGTVSSVVVRFSEGQQRGCMYIIDHMEFRFPLTIYQESFRFYAKIMQLLFFHIFKPSFLLEASANRAFQPRNSSPVSYTHL